MPVPCVVCFKASFGEISMIDPNFMADYNRLIARPLLERPVVRRFWPEIVENLRTPVEVTK